MAERLRLSVEKFDFDTGEGRILKKTCSIGFASFPFAIERPEAYSWEQVIDIADHGLYAAKKSSRNCWVGLENIDYNKGNQLANVTEKMEELIAAGHLKAINSPMNNKKLKWANPD